MSKTAHMPRECAFCPATAKMSGEHIWSDWMNGLLPGKKRFISKDKDGKVIFQRIAKELDWTAKVVCKPCNETWMSKIEGDHAKPSMEDLITGKLDIPIMQSRANSIALFGFKTAVVLDHLRRDPEPFF
jgi:hypothetical protein